jgi:hypothetical protein
MNSALPNPFLNPAIASSPDHPVVTEVRPPKATRASRFVLDQDKFMRDLESFISMPRIFPRTIPTR